MVWTLSRDITTESNIRDTNMLMAPWGSGVPASSAEHNVNYLLANQRGQEVIRSITPSGFLTRLQDVSLLETTTDLDIDGELVALTTGGAFVANTLRIGRSKLTVNGWKINLSNNYGTNGLHNNVVLDTAPTTSSRYDLVFLEVWLAELGGTSATISNTANKPDATHIWMFGNTQYIGQNAIDDISEIDAEINRRWQIQYRIRVVDGVNIDTYSDGVTDTVNVKAWGAGNWSGYAAGAGSPYTFQPQANVISTSNDVTCYVAGDGSTVAKSVLGTVDGYVYAVPIAAVFRRNSGIYNTATNPLGCATTGGSGGNIASGVSGRPDGFYYDQIDVSDIISLRHQTIVDVGFELTDMASFNFDKVLRGKMLSSFGVGDGSGAPSALRSTHPLYAQEIAPEGSVDGGFRGFSQFDYQRRKFSDAAFTQQTQFTFTGGASPDGSKPTTLSAPIAPTASTSTSTGTLPANTYAIVVTYTNQYGESLPSTQSSSYTLSASGELVVNSPVSSGNASGWNVYITNTPGSGWKKQNSNPIAIGTNYTQSVALISGAVPPASNTTSSTLVITADSSGLSSGTAKVVCVDGTSTPSSGNLPGSVNILVYDASTLTAVSGTWSGLNTATATFTPSSPWSSSNQTNGVVAVVGTYYPAGNGLPLRPESLVSQSVIQGGSTYTMAQIGVTGTYAADNAHLNTPNGVYVDTSGNVFIADTLNHRVVKYNSSFVYQAQFGVTGTSGADNTHLNSPVSVVADTSGNIYIADSLNHRIVKLNSGLAYVTQFGVTGVSGSDTSHLNTPKQIVIDPGQSNIYIADSLNNRIVRLSIALVYGATTVASVTGVQGVTVDANGNIYISYNQLVSKYNSGGTLLLTYGTAGVSGNTIYTLNNPTGITLDSSGNVLVADTGNHRLVLLNPGFVYIGQSGTTSLYSTDNGRYNTPVGVAFDSNGLYYVADSLNHRVIKLHKEMGCFDAPTRTFQVMASGAPSDKLQLFYRYKPYQGIIGSQGNNAFTYTLRALTNINSFVTTCGTGGKNSYIEDQLNGSIVRLPFPATYFGNSATNDIEAVETGVALSGGMIDPSPMLSGLPASWGGSMNLFSPDTANGNQASNLIAGSQIVLTQNTTLTVFPARGVNSIERYIGGAYQYNSGYDYLGVSFGSLNSVDHMTYGYFLAVASGGESVLPLVKGEIVLVVAGFRVNGSSAALYGQPTEATTVDIFRLAERPVVYY